MFGNTVESGVGFEATAGLQVQGSLMVLDKAEDKLVADFKECLDMPGSAT